MDCVKCHHHIRKTDINNVKFNIGQNGDIIGVFNCPHCGHSFFIKRQVTTEYVPYIAGRRKGEQSAVISLSQKRRQLRK